MALQIYFPSSFLLPTDGRTDEICFAAKMTHNVVIRRYSTLPLNSESASRLTIAPVLDEDSGEFDCEAANRFGRDRKRFYLAVEDVPSPPSDVQLRNVDSRSVEIAWKTPHNGNSPILNYVIEYTNVVVDSSSSGS